MTWIMEGRTSRIALLAALVAVAGWHGATAQAQPEPCDTRPTGIATSDYFIDFRTGGMPDKRFDNRDARLRVHAVEPVYANGKCRGVQTLATVLVHGRSNPGSSTFDLRHPTEADPSGEALSQQAALARAGIHSFAPDLIGYGRSTRFADGLDEPCNASLPTDKTRNANVFPLNQQGRYLGDGLTPTADGLGVNPLRGVLCTHVSSTYFANPDVFASNIMLVIDDVIARVRPRGNKVVLVGNSFGGPSVARTLYRLGEGAGRKIQRVVFLSALFNRFGGVPVDTNLPTEEADLPAVERSTSFPLTVARLGGWTGVTSSARDGFCTGRVVDGAPAALRTHLLGLDPIGSAWGGGDPDRPTGLLRSPTFSLYGWNRPVAATFTVPTLILHGADDTVAPVSNSEAMFDALTSVEERVLVQVQCGSHMVQQEGCSLARCDDRDAATTPYGSDTAVWEGPSSTISAALIEWVRHGTFDGSACGRFDVDASGIARPVPSSACD